jgi:hypothetical protein
MVREGIWWVGLGVVLWFSLEELIFVLYGCKDASEFFEV